MVIGKPAEARYDLRQFLETGPCQESTRGRPTHMLARAFSGLQLNERMCKFSDENIFEESYPLSSGVMTTNCGTRTEIVASRVAHLDVDYRCVFLAVQPLPGAKAGCI